MDQSIKINSTVYSLILFLEAAFFFQITLVIPSDPKGSIFLGLSIMRLGLLTCFAVLLFCSAIFAWLIWRRSQFILPKIKNFLESSLLVTTITQILGVIFILGCGFLFYFIQWFPRSLYIYQRIQPLIFVITLFAGQTIILLTVLQARILVTARKLVWLIIIGCVFAGIGTAITQKNYIKTLHGLNYISTTDKRWHDTIVRHRITSPYRYRILTDYVLEGVLKAVPVVNQTLEPLGIQLAEDYTTIAIRFRMVQNTFIMLAAYLIYRKMGFSPLAQWMGVLFLAYGMPSAYTHSPLSYYTYTEVFILLAAFVTPGVLIPALTVIGALSREGTVFVPILYALNQMNLKTNKLFQTLNKKQIFIVTSSLVLFFLIYFGLRWALGPAKYAGSGYGLIYPGLELVRLNLCNPGTWRGLWYMFHFLPLGLLLVHRWSPQLKARLAFFGIPWIVMQFWFGSADETRLFLAPLAIVFIPGFIYSVQYLFNRWNVKAASAAAPFFLTSVLFLFSMPLWAADARYLSILLIPFAFWLLLSMQHLFFHQSPGH